METHSRYTSYTRGQRLSSRASCNRLARRPRIPARAQYIYPRAGTGSTSNNVGTAMHLMDPPDDPDKFGHRFVLNHFFDGGSARRTGLYRRPIVSWFSISVGCVDVSNPKAVVSQELEEAGTTSAARPVRTFHCLSVRQGLDREAYHRHPPTWQHHFSPSLSCFITH